MAHYTFVNGQGQSPKTVHASDLIPDLKTLGYTVYPQRIETIATAIS